MNGTTTTAVVAVAAITGISTSRAPRSAAWIGDSPAFHRRCTLSSTTIALSSIRPKPIARPISVSMFSVSPLKWIRFSVARIENAMVANTISADRTERRKISSTMKMTPAPMSARKRRSLICARTASLWSSSRMSRTPPGVARPATRARTA